MYDGYVFLCNKTDQQQCLSSKKYTCQEKQNRPAEPIKEGSVIFLYNPDEKTLLGPFTALTEGGEELDSGAWAESVEENIPSQDLKVIWEQLHLLKDADEKLPLLRNHKGCRLTSLETQNVLDTLSQSEVYLVENAEDRL